MIALSYRDIVPRKYKDDDDKTQPHDGINVISVHKDTSRVKASNTKTTVIFPLTWSRGALLNWGMMPPVIRH